MSIIALSFGIVLRATIQALYCLVLPLVAHTCAHMLYCTVDRALATMAPIMIMPLSRYTALLDRICGRFFSRLETLLEHCSRAHCPHSSEPTLQICSTGNAVSLNANYLYW